MIYHRTYNYNEVIIENALYANLKVHFQTHAIITKESDSN